MKHLLYAVLGWLAVAFAPMAAQAEIREYNLTIGSKSVSIDGHTRNKISINGTIPGPVLRFTEGDEAVIHVTNTLKEETSIHWHGMIVPGSQDGVPGFNGFDGIAPGQTFTYRFPIKQAGTYWYHAHSMGQEQDGLYAGLLIAPASADLVQSDQDYTIVLADESLEDSEDIQAHLKMSSDYYQYHRRTVGDFFNDVHKMGLGKALASAGMWGKMNMLPTDLSDVEGYHFTINGMTPGQNWTGLFKSGQRIRLRFINAASMTMYDIRIPGLKMTVVSADGQPVEPVDVDEFRIGNAETYDVIVTPQDDKAYTIAAESIDRTGFAIGTLAPREGMKGEIPAQRPRSILSMSDMNMQKMMMDDPKMDMSAMDAPAAWGDHHAPAGTTILDYSDLKFAGVQADLREPTREITVHLDGNMERYIWTINGKTFDPAVGIHLAYNERVRLTFINDSMMAHPMHLHGMFVQLDNGQPADKLPNKHTVIVPPGQTVSVLLTADNVGTWAFHCHLMFHMLSGMMTDVVVSPPGQPVLPDDRTADGAPVKPVPGTMAPMAAGMDMNHGDMKAMDMKNMDMGSPQTDASNPQSGMTMDHGGMQMSAPAAAPTQAPATKPESMGQMDMSNMDMTAPATDKPAAADSTSTSSSGTQPPPKTTAPAKASKAKPKAKPKPKQQKKESMPSMPGMDMSHMDMGGDHAH